MAYVLDYPVRKVVQPARAQGSGRAGSVWNRRFKRIATARTLAAISVGSLLIVGTAASVTLQPASREVAAPTTVISAAVAAPEGRSLPRPRPVAVRPAAHRVAIRRAPAVVPVQHQVVEASYVSRPVAATPSGWGCGPALSWLASHAAPGFRFECPGYALGHQAMTCQNVPGVCPGARIIAIAVPCAAAYMNEAYNSWIVERGGNSGFDPYGYCH